MSGGRSAELPSALGTFSDAIEHPIDKAGRFSGSKGSSQFNGFIDGYQGGDVVIKEEFVGAEAQDGPVDTIQSFRRVVVYDNSKFLVYCREMRA